MSKMVEIKYSSPKAGQKLKKTFNLKGEFNYSEGDGIILDNELFKIVKVTHVLNSLKKDYEVTTEAEESKIILHCEILIEEGCDRYEYF